MSPPATLTHDAMFYAGDDEFLTALVPFVRDGLARGQAVAAAVTRPNIALLRDALGADADAVSFIDRDSWYSRPASTVAGWQRLLAEAGTRGQAHMRLIGEVGFGAEHRHPTWTRYEAALNQVFAQAPAWIVCPYDTRVLPAAVLDDVRRTHPVTLHPERRRSRSYLPAEQYLREVPEPMPPVAGPPVITMAIEGGVAPARHALHTLMAESGWSPFDRGEDLILALSEITANSIRHGREQRELRVWVRGSTVTCEVSDNGDGPADPLAGYRPPATSLTGGRGLWIAQQLCDAMAIAHSGGTTRVRFAVTLTEMFPAGAETSGRVTG
jgi:anti-sigma regulatory factor (Ser/Thr protein kinase)